MIQNFGSDNEDLALFKALDSQIQDVLGRINYIAVAIQTNKKIPIEDLPRKIRKALQEIKRHLMQEPNLSDTNQLSASGIELEENPLVDDLGGMPLDAISSEWPEFDEDAATLLDQAELENLIKNKLRKREELSNRLKNNPQLQNKPQSTPKAAPAITPKFAQAIKYIYKEMPSAPEPRERPLPRPRGPM